MQSLKNYSRDLPYFFNRFVNEICFMKHLEREDTSLYFYPKKIIKMFILTTKQAFET
jgi:hypothetical protein